MGVALENPTTGKRGRSHLVGWQGFTFSVPEEWDLTGFSGTEESGYLRVDDSAEQGLEIKWATEPAKSKTPPDVTVRRESYMLALKKAAKKKKIEFEARDVDAPRSVQSEERSAAGFVWTGDRKGIGAVWHCSTCRRTVIVQVIGDRSGRGGLSGLATDVLATVRCHGETPGWRTWAIYDLVTEIPEDYRLVGQELMNVYLRLEFARKTSQISVEQWSLANMARRDQYLDIWVASNSKSVIREARYEAVASENHGHPSLNLTGGLAVGVPMLRAAREVTRFKRPATRFEATAWECEATNKVYAVQWMHSAREDGVCAEVARRTICHQDKERGKRA